MALVALLHSSWLDSPSCAPVALKLVSDRLRVTGIVVSSFMAATFPVSQVSLQGTDSLRTSLTESTRF